MTRQISGLHFGIIVVVLWVAVCVTGTLYGQLSNRTRQENAALTAAKVTDCEILYNLGMDDLARTNDSSSSLPIEFRIEANTRATANFAAYQACRVHIQVIK